LATLMTTGTFAPVLIAPQSLIEPLALALDAFDAEQPVARTPAAMASTAQAAPRLTVRIPLHAYHPHPDPHPMRPGWAPPRRPTRRGRGIS
jgi:hypothetical protein